MRNRGIEKPTININDVLYEILAEYDTYRIKDTKELKLALNADIVVSKSKGTEKKYLVCKKVEDATIIEDVEN